MRGERLVAAHLSGSSPDWSCQLNRTSSRFFVRGRVRSRVASRSMPILYTVKTRFPRATSVGSLKVI